MLQRSWTPDAGRRERLHQLLDLARTYRGWSRNRLARELDRDPTGLYSKTDDPRFGFVIGLANILEWPIDAVRDFLWTGTEPESDTSSEFADHSFHTLYPAAQLAYKEGRYADVISMAAALVDLATTPVERARAHNAASAGWDGVGRIDRSVSELRAALQQTPLDTSVRISLQGNLANAHYGLWELPEAIGIATYTIDWFENGPHEDFTARTAQAYALYVRGNAYRRCIALEPERSDELARRGLKDLSHATSLYRTLADQTSQSHFAALAHTCDSGILELEVETGDRSAQATIEQFCDRILPATNPADVPAGSWLESYGWTSIFGGNVALRHLAAPDLQRPLAVFINKALEISDLSDNWVFRERVLTMEHQLRTRVGDQTGFAIDPVVDEEDIRIIAGTMARFPRFQAIGMQILRSARLVTKGRGGRRFSR